MYEAICEEVRNESNDCVVFTMLVDGNPIVVRNLIEQMSEEQLLQLRNSFDVWPTIAPPYSPQFNRKVQESYSLIEAVEASRKQDKIISLLRQSKLPEVPIETFAQKLWRNMNTYLFSWILLTFGLASILVGIYNVNQKDVGIGTIIALLVILIVFLGVNCYYRKTSNQPQQKPHIRDLNEPSEPISTVSAENQAKNGNCCTKLCKTFKEKVSKCWKNCWQSKKGELGVELNTSLLCLQLSLVHQCKLLGVFLQLFLVLVLSHVFPGCDLSDHQTSQPTYWQQICLCGVLSSQSLYFSQSTKIIFYLSCPKVCLKHSCLSNWIRWPFIIMTLLQYNYIMPDKTQEDVKRFIKQLKNTNFSVDLYCNEWQKSNHYNGLAKRTFKALNDHHKNLLMLRVGYALRLAVKNKRPREDAIKYELVFIALKLYNSKFPNDLYLRIFNRAKYVDPDEIPNIEWEIKQPFREMKKGFQKIIKHVEQVKDKVVSQIFR